TKRLRDLERAYDSTTNRAIAIEQDIMSLKKNNSKIFDEFRERIDKQERELRKIEETIREMTKQLKFFATKAKVEELESMLDIFNPLESAFVTKDEARKIIREEMRRRQ
ncbi:MAG: hypothetical protein GXO64_03060, partial [Candidatus Micrarchaeota archaeon]|nr:hypothetical protein [Candidatus Micrarchaeota archaeon]